MRARWDRARRRDWQRPGYAAHRPRRLGRCWPLERPMERCGSVDWAPSHFVAGPRCVRRERTVLLPQRPPPRRPPSLHCPGHAGAPDCCAGWVGSVGRVSLHRGCRRCGPWFAAAAQEPQFAAPSRAAPAPKRAGRRTDGQAAGAPRAAPTRAARRCAGQPVARRRVAQTRVGRAPREVRPPREVPGPGEVREPRELRARLPVFLPVSLVARLRLSPAQQKR